MAAPCKQSKVYNFLRIFVYIVVISDRFSLAVALYQLRPSDIEVIVENSCVFASNEHADQKTVEIVTQLIDLYREDQQVLFGSVTLTGFTWPDGRKLDSLDPTGKSTSGLVLFRRHKPDRSCLQLPNRVKWHQKAEHYQGVVSLEVLVNFINSECGTFRNVAGFLNSAGLHRRDILENLFHPSSVSDVNMRRIFTCSRVSSTRNLTSMGAACPEPAEEAVSSSTSQEKHEKEKYTSKNNPEKYESSPVEMAKCAVLEKVPSKEEFFHEYLKVSKPVIIKGAAKRWEAFTKWSHDFFHSNFGSKEVHIKLTQGGDFEGVEKAELWEDFKTFQIPAAVREQLQFPDLVTVRPAALNMNFSEFLSLITWAAAQPERNVSAYLEYSSIPEYMPELEEDLSEFTFAGEQLRRKHLNMWLSDGNTIGRLHFDAFDNLLCQLRGKKEVILFDPHDNTRLYEAHIPQAMLGYNKETKQFRKKTLEDSTSMVMSPVNIREPDFERFPLFAETTPLNCTIEEGDVLYMPSFWWHEVYSHPNSEEKRNLAVNYWYEPFLTKEFPCADCKLDVNPYYHHLL